MSDLQFDDGQNEFMRAPEQQSNGFDLSGKLVEWGLVSNRQEATYVLMAIGALALVVAFLLMRMGGGGDAPPLLPQ